MNLITEIRHGRSDSLADLSYNTHPMMMMMMVMIMIMIMMMMMISIKMRPKQSIKSGPVDWIVEASTTHWRGHNELHLNSLKKQRDVPSSLPLCAAVCPG